MEKARQQGCELASLLQEAESRQEVELGSQISRPALSDLFPPVKLLLPKGSRTFQNHLPAGDQAGTFHIPTTTGDVDSLPLQWGQRDR